MFVVEAVDVNPVSVSVLTGSEAKEQDRDEDGQSDVDPQTPNFTWSSYFFAIGVG